MRTQANNALLSRLARENLEFVVIGGFCCIYHGVPIATFALDICCRFDEGSLTKIERAVSDVHPFHRLTPQKLAFVLTPELKNTLKNLYLQTDLGRLDCLGEVEGIGSYRQAYENSEVGQLVSGEYRFLNLDALIRSKEIAGRERDYQHLRFLKPLKERREQQSKKPRSE